LVDVLAATPDDAIVPGVHRVDLIPADSGLAGVEMSLVTEFGRERFRHDALETVLNEYDEVVFDILPNLGLLTVNALLGANRVLAPVSAEDEGAVHGVLELRVTITKLAPRLDREAPNLIPLITRWSSGRISSRTVEDRLGEAGLPPMARIRPRSTLVSAAAAAGIPVARLAPDSTVAIAYSELVELLASPGGTMTARRRRGLLVDDPSRRTGRASGAGGPHRRRDHRLTVAQHPDGTDPGPTRSSPASGSTTQPCVRSPTRSASAAYSSP
jgi:cellulose biosynthesis protein BcsQ